VQAAVVQSASIPTNALTAKAPTQPRAAPYMGDSGINKPLPRTCYDCLYSNVNYVSNYTDKAFVRRLISNLRHSCAIGYNRPQFTYFASYLQSVSQQPKVFDATLDEECNAGGILGPFQHPSLQSFCTSGLGLYSNMTESGKLFIIFLHCTILVIMLFTY